MRSSASRASLMRRALWRSISKSRSLSASRRLYSASSAALLLASMSLRRCSLSFSSRSSLSLITRSLASSFSLIARSLASSINLSLSISARRSASAFLSFSSLSLRRYLALFSFARRIARNLSASARSLASLALLIASCFA